MPATHQNLRALLAQGNLESALQSLVALTAHSDDADLRQRVLTLSGQFAALKKQHLTGLLNDSDYRLQLNRITAAVAEVVDSEANSEVVTQSHRLTTPSFWKKIGYVGLVVGILAGAVQVVEYVQKQKPVPVEKPAAEPLQKDPVVVPAPQANPPAAGKNNVKIEVKDKAKVGNIITGDSNKIDIKQDF